MDENTTQPADDGMQEAGTMTEETHEGHEEGQEGTDQAA